MNFDHVDLDGLVFFLSSILSGSYTLSKFSSTGLSEPLGEGLDVDISISAECSEVSHSLHNVWMQISVPNTYFWYYMQMILLSYKFINIVDRSVSTSQVLET